MENRILYCKIKILSVFLILKYSMHFILSPMQFYNANMILKRLYNSSPQITNDFSCYFAIQCFQCRFNNGCRYKNLLNWSIRKHFVFRYFTNIRSSIIRYKTLIDVINLNGRSTWFHGYKSEWETRQRSECQTTMAIRKRTCRTFIASLQELSLPSRKI